MACVCRLFEKSCATFDLMSDAYDIPKYVKRMNVIVTAPLVSEKVLSRHGTKEGRLLSKERGQGHENKALGFTYFVLYKEKEKARTYAA